ncbi:unnamed protein product [Linum trigynum]|uniref:Integrase catalytic domain-containing protein n=1 Tax=Linum trigynum TaxID=586398 RepID=A0AAV2E8I7_9ROSI
MRWFTNRNIFTHFGLSESIVMGHGKQFDCKQFIEFCDEKGFILRFSSASYPQANGQAEAANKSILHGLHTRLLGAKGKWVEELPGVLWAHQTTYKLATRESPFSLTYGSEAVIPVSIPTFRMVNNEAQSNEEEHAHDLKKPRINELGGH